MHLAARFWSVTANSRQLMTGYFPRYIRVLPVQRPLSVLESDMQSPDDRFCFVYILGLLQMGY